MEENSNQDNVKTFSFQMKEFGDESLTFEQTFMQTRHYAIELINLVAAGKTEFSPEDKKAIRIYNRYCKMAGQKPLEGDFCK